MNPINCFEFSNLQLIKTEESSVLKILRKCGKYVAEVKERTIFLAKTEVLANEGIHLLNLKFCPDPGYLESLVKVCLITGVSDVS